MILGEDTQITEMSAHLIRINDKLTSEEADKHDERQHFGTAEEEDDLGFRDEGYGK